MSSLQHLYPMGKGDPLCPLGFHPQVRWPTRCKRCFRDYKEHGGKRKEPEIRKDDITASSPSLGSYGSQLGNRRSWSSSTTLDTENDKKETTVTFKNPSSWTSTPDLANLEDDTSASIPTVSLTLPLRKKISLDTGQKSELTKERENQSTVFSKSDSLATRAKKLQSIKEGGNSSGQQNKPRRIHIKEIKAPQEEISHDNDVKTKPKKYEGSYYSRPNSLEVEDDSISLAETDTSESTTLVDHNDFDLREQMKSLRKELETSKIKCERLEKEKSNILLRRLTAMDTSKGNSSEVLKLQQKVNELKSQLEDYRDEKKALNYKVKELEDDLDNRPTPQATQKMVDELKSKLSAAETLCEELMDENEDMKKELQDLEEEIEEMQDNFREDQADEYTSLKKELEQTTKNCRILSFKLRKTERKTEQLEQEKQEAETKLKELSAGTSLQHLERIKQLEKELNTEKETNSNIQKKLDDANLKLTKAEETKYSSNTLPKKKAPSLGTLGKSASSDMKVSRESLTRGGSQDDPVQLLRDLQDSLEREADLREQLKFAEEEAETTRKKASRIEDDNESLVMQLKKMATRTRSNTRKATPTRDVGKDEDPSDIKLQLELSEQETTVLRKKIEELDSDNERLKKKTKELQDKLTIKTSNRRVISKLDTKDNENYSDKIKALESEIKEIRGKLVEKEQECKSLESEINLNKKRPQEMTKTVDQQTVDLRRQLQIIEQEASIFRNKAQTLEAENEKLQAEKNRLELVKGAKTAKADKTIDTYIDKIASLEIELETASKKITELEEKKTTKPGTNGDIQASKEYKKLEKERDKLQALLDKLAESSSTAFKKRKANTPTELTTKLALKTMVSDLENEVIALLVTLGKTEETVQKLEGELTQGKVQKTSKEFNNREIENLTKKLETLERDHGKDKEKIEELGRMITNNEVEKEELKLKIQKLNSEQAMLNTENTRLESENSKLKSDSMLLKSSKQNLAELTDRNEELKREVVKKETEMKKLRDEIEDKSKLSKELTLKIKKIAELQKQIKELESDKNKMEKTNSEKLKIIENQLEEEKQKCKATNSECNGLKEKQSLELKNLNSKIQELESTINSKNTKIIDLEKDLQKERTATSVVIKTPADTKELEKLKTELKEMDAKYKTCITKQHIAEEKLKNVELELKTEKDNLNKKCTALEVDLQNEKKQAQLFKTNFEKEHKAKESECATLKNKIKALELNSSGGSKKIIEIRQEYQEKLDKLEKTLEKEKHEYENLTAKYEVLEEEHVVTKAKLVTEKESLSAQLLLTKKDLEKMEENLEASKKEMQTKYDNLLKEMQKKTNGNDSLEKTRLKALLDERQSELEQIKKENEVINDQMEYMRRENDELRKKLDDFDKVSKVQRNISADSSAMDKEIRELKLKLNALEKTKKSDVTECKMRYESQITVLSEEMRSLHAQVQRFKRERDTYKHMLEGAQKTIGDLKANPNRSRDNRNSISSNDDIEEFKSKIATLEQQISCMEDELSESRLEASKLKTELVSERSSWEVKLSEMNSHVNELEEEKILSSGRTKIAGLRTRMELSWQKEREEQQRILQETATLARDLRQTLFEVERERDKEVLEGKRKLDQLKKTLEEDQSESKKKLNELQCDFMELRDAHAKLRTTNEKLRREKERHERDREEIKLMLYDKKRSEQDDVRRVQILVQQVENLLQVAPELFGERTREAPYTPTPPKRTKSKSRESSPALERKDYSSRESSIVRDDKKSQVQMTLQRLVDATEELKRMQERERDKIKRVGLRRATSTENDQIASNGSTRKLTRTDSNLHRKSLSLEQTSTMQDHNIWKGADDDSISSLQSLEMGSDLDFRRKRDISMDSRLSGGSTQSEVAGEKKKKQGIMGKLKKLTKSRSIDDQDDSQFSPTRPLSSKISSNHSETGDEKGSKKDLKDRITGMFKRSGSQSRGNSMERQIIKHDTSSTQRPLTRNGSNSNMAAINSGNEKVAKTKKTIKT